jgi:hypothetical protein
MQRTPKPTRWFAARDAVHPYVAETMLARGDARHNRLGAAAYPHERIAAQRVGLRDLALMLDSLLEPSEARETVGRDDRVGLALRTRLSKGEWNAHERNGNRVTAIHQRHILWLTRQSRRAAMWI